MIPLNVIKEMVRTKRNMRAVIDNLKLQMSVQGLYGATSISVSEDNENMININATSVSGRLAADVANELAKVFLKSYEEMRNSAVKKRFDYFSHQKIQVIEHIDALEEEKKAYLAKNNISAIALEGASDFGSSPKLVGKQH